MDENSLSSLFSEATPGADASPEQRNEPENRESQQSSEVNGNGNFPPFSQDPVVLLPLTNATHRPTSTLKLEYTASLPEYPETDPCGFTYVVYVGGQDAQTVGKLMHEIQYHKKIISPPKPIYCHFLDAKVVKHRFRCTGIKTCPLFSEDLKAIRHTSLTDDLHKYLKRSQQAADLCQTNPSARAHAYSFFKSLELQFQNGYACARPRPDCRPQIYQPDVTAQGQTDPGIRCVNASSDPGGHYWKPVHEIPSFDLKTAVEVFGPDAALYLNNCDMVYSTTTRLTSCRMPHLAGVGKLQEQSCNVVFQVMIPYDLQSRPYILFLSHGVHQHMPPMPARAPPLLTERTIQLVAKAKSSDNNLPVFLKPPAPEALCGEEYSGLSISDIRKRITSGNPLAAALARQRLLRYLGTHYYLTTLLELDRCDTAKEYLQEVYQDKEGVMIICALKEQLDLLVSVKGLEVHIKSRLLRHTTLYEVVFAACEEAGGFGQMALPLVRVFTDYKSSQSFCHLFQRVFELARLLTGYEKPICFHHIHRSGYRSVLIDMDRDLYTGFGQYLSEIDPAHRDVTWQLRNIIMFCKPHFLRKVTDLVGVRVKNVMLWDQLARLIDCSSKQEYERISELLTGSANENVEKWAPNLKDPIIAAGLNVHFSSMPSGIYTSFRRRKTAAEETHNADQVQHIRSLLPTLKWSWNEDKAIMGRFQSCVTAGRPPAPEPTIIRYPANPPPPRAPPPHHTMPPPPPHHATPQSSTLPQPQRITSEVPSKRKHSEVDLSSPSVEVDNGPVDAPDDDTPARDAPQQTPLPSHSDSLVRSWLASTNMTEAERREDERIQLLLMELRIKKKRNELMEHELKARRLRMELEQDEKDFQRAKEESQYWKDRPLDGKT
ncbi:hypothetical protein VTN77DRAFT_5560 [Rasamsonia byssochlamydoides]|uniref:uncharacterized protein n=1 Tax=Rasamsonia byssochlamydoides TaxID=89139 RepID=UPI0037440852